MLEKLAAPNGGQLLIVPHAGYKADVTMKDELNSTVAALNHGYAIGVVAPAGSPLPEITVAKRPQIKVRAHVISGSQPNPDPFPRGKGDRIFEKCLGHLLSVRRHVEVVAPGADL